MHLLKGRLLKICFLPLLAFLVFSARFYYFQIHKGEQYRNFSRDNILRTIRLPAPRGRILDRNGKRIVYNKPLFNIYAAPNEINNPRELSEKLSRIVNVEQEKLTEKLTKSAAGRSFYPVLVTSDISWEELLRFERNKSELSGLILELGYKRHYPGGDLAAPLLGYSGFATEDEMKSDKMVDPQTLLGKTGVEKVFDDEIRGVRGLKSVTVDAHGKIVSDSFFSTVARKQAREMIPGKDIHLTIDLDVQKVAEETLGEESGSIIVMDVRNGEILAMVSHPNYSLEEVSGRIPQDMWKKFEQEKSSPFLNRATQGTYPPGSIMKIVTAFALLKEKTADPADTVQCPGYFVLNQKRFNCWRKEGHGPSDLKKAIAESCDVYFYKRSLQLGAGKLHEYIEKFGFGKKTGIILPEKTGINPSPYWKRKNLKEPWYPGETLIMSIGQGYITATPIQISVMTAAVANGGKLVKPVLRKELQTESTTRPVEGLDEESLSFLRDSLHKAVNGDRGTGVLAGSAEVSVSGKTGTAQVVSSSVKSKEKRFMDHALFTSYAPSDSPEISVTIVVENGGSGGLVAAPMAKKIFEAYFELKESRNEI